MPKSAPWPIDHGKTIGGDRTFIIAEVGSNHDQNLNVAFDSIEAAAEAGADAIKFQSLQMNALYYDPPEDVRRLYDQIDLEEDWHARLKEHCDKQGVVFFSSPTYLEAVSLLRSVDVALFKLASAQVGTFPQLVDRVAAQGKPTLLSTGLVTYGELERTIQRFQHHNNERFVILHCNSLYPTPFERVHLPLMDTYGAMFRGRVGFSDHTPDIFAPLAAVARGASVIEKHFTLSRRFSTPDAPISLEPDAFKRMVEGIRAVEKTLTPAVRTGLEQEERSFKESLRYRLVLDVDKQAGDSFREDDFRFLRHDRGVDCRDLRTVLKHTRAKNLLSKGSVLEWKDLEGTS